jgi:hypothetical protein
MNTLINTLQCMWGGCPHVLHNGNAALMLISAILIGSILKVTLSKR